MRPSWGTCFGSGWCRGEAVLVVLGLAMTLGCGHGPFSAVPVSGKVTFRDGSLIKADRIVVTLVPQGAAASGKMAAPGARGDVNVADGTFAGLTTHKPMDGVVLGRHKVVVQPLKKGPGGMDMPLNVIPARYTQPDKTPLEVEVKKSRESLTLLIDPQ
jgi:hypothetical protein